MKRRKRAHISRRATVFATHGHKCYWCGVPLVEVRSIKGHRRIKRTGDGFMHFYDKHGVLRVVKFATIDHVIPRSEGGGNQIWNMVPSCALCNGMRNSGHVFDRAPPEVVAEPPRPPKPPKIPEEPVYCERCGRQRHNRLLALCLQCRMEDALKLRGGLEVTREAT